MITEKSQMQTKQMKQKKVCLVSSQGGHFLELYDLKPFWQGHDRFWMVCEGPDTKELLKIENKIYWVKQTKRNPMSYIKSLIQFIKILKKEKPTLLVTTGANLGAVAVHAAKLLGIKSVFLELTARVENLSLAARLSRPFATHLLVQWEELAQKMKHTEFQGRVI